VTERENERERGIRREKGKEKNVGTVKKEKELLKFSYGIERQL
jgi:hypothetical protein